MKKFLAFGAMLLLAGSCTQQNNSTNVYDNQTQALQNLETKSISINGTAIDVVVADTIEKQKRGLSGQESLAENHGMLFDFTASGAVDLHYFWMIDMRFDIDIIWIRDGKIIGIEKNVPKPAVNASPSELPRYPSPGIVDYVLEVNAGWSDAHTIKIGDSVQI